MNEIDLKHYNQAYAKSPEKAFVYAVCYGHFKEAKQLLLKEGIDVNLDSSTVPSPETREPLLCSVAGDGLTRAVQFLIENGANINDIGRNDMTPLMNACSHGKIKGEKVANMLIEAGADVTYVRDDDMTALKFSFENGSKSLIQTLIDKGADVNQHGVRQTPLMLAARKNNVEAIELLLQHGADPEAKCTLSWAQGLTAEGLAKLEGCKKAYTYLKNYRLSTLK